MYKYFINICLLFVFAESFSQEQNKEPILNIEKDTIVYKTNYGLRLGIDISKPIKSIFNSTYSGFEVVGDYRIKKNVYVAAEVGYEEETSDEFQVSNSISKGNYIRLGVNYNAYKNWLDMNNEIFLGYRYGFSIFDQTLNSYTLNVSDQENGNYFPAVLNTNSIKTSSLNAHWSELIVGIKAETFHNFFVSFSVSYKILMSVKDPENFKSLYAPGFNRIFDSNSGFGFNYTLSYLIPFSKK